MEVLAGIVLYPGFFLYGILRHQRVSNNARYTVATTIRRVSTLKLGAEIEFEYFENGTKYKGHGYDQEKYQIQYPNGRYPVKYSDKNPSACEYNGL